MDTKTTSTRMNLVYFATLALAALPACGPCEAYVETAGTVNLCPGGDDEDGGESTGGLSTTDALTGGDTASECVGAPAPQALGGPCSPDITCLPSGDVQPVCVVTPTGSICSPPCPYEGTCSDVMCGAADACVPGATCVQPCTYPSDCPHDGMVCDPSGQCLWPDIDTCETADVPGQPFAPCLPDFSCAAAGTICATDDNGWVCIPISSEGCAEEFAACAGSGGFGKGYGAQVDACTLGCGECPAGMECGTLFGLCVWPD